MSVEAMSWAFRQPVEPSAAKFILVALGNFADEAGYCFPSQQRLADDTSQSVRSVRLHLANLEREGWIRREKRRRQDGTNASDGFRLCWDNRPAAKSAASTNDEQENDQRQNSPAADLTSGEIFQASGRSCQTPAAESAGHITITAFDEPSLGTVKRGRAKPFDQWWPEYPHKVGKGAAERVFPKAIAEAGSVDVLIHGVRRYIRTKPPDRPWCNPATWLNQKRWLDEEGPQSAAGVNTLNVLRSFADDDRSSRPGSPDGPDPIDDFVLPPKALGYG